MMSLLALNNVSNIVKMLQKASFEETCLLGAQIMLMSFFFHFFLFDVGFII